MMYYSSIHVITPLVASCQLLVVSCQLSVVRSQLSVASCQFPAASNYSLLIAIFQWLHSSCYFPIVYLKLLYILVVSCQLLNATFYIIYSSFQFLFASCELLNITFQLLFSCCCYLVTNYLLLNTEFQLLLSNCYCLGATI